MKVVILAAGLSRRLQTITNGLPKPLVVLGDRTILERTITACARLDLKDILVISGHQHLTLEQAAQSISARLGVHCTVQYNESFAVKNNCYSLLLALESVNRDNVLLINGDVVFDQRILGKMLAHHGTALAIDSSVRLDQESMKVASDGYRLLGLSKNIDIAVSYAEYIGIAVISSSDVRELRDSLTEVINDDPNQYYEAAFHRLCTNKVIGLVDVAGLAWEEIDTEIDFSRAVARITSGEFKI